jgi:formate hydrogenlyase subunit 6/NADH:ubiquinone oxidoreductase subunit I
MPEAPYESGDPAIFSVDNLQALLDALTERDYQIIGPTVRDGAISYEEIKSAAELPAGWTDEQKPGAYRLKQSGNALVFGYGSTPQSWKRFLHLPVLKLWEAQKDGTGFRIVSEPPHPQAKLAFIGVRSCDLHAIGIQDKVFLEGSHVDPGYKSRRDGVFIVAVNCGEPGGTCFCASMNTGPKVAAGFDLALTEVLENGHHYFLVETGSAAGADVLEAIPHLPASEFEKEEAALVTAQARARMGRSLDTNGLKELLYRNCEHPRWDQVAARCLTCANCTMVCPTCFCTTVEDVTDLKGEHAERWRKWDSCFTTDFSYIHGGSVRATPRARYRQWMTHKLATWNDQFGVSGCVGCGRCITWCPAAIDITEEVRAIRETDFTVISRKENGNGKS